MKETKEMEKNQLESIQNDDYAVSEDEDFQEEEEDAKANLGVWIGL